MAKKKPTTKRKNAEEIPDVAARIRRIAEQEEPNMEVVEPAPETDELSAPPDAVAPDITQVQRKYGVDTPADSGPTEELHVVTMRPKDKGTDASSRGGPQVRRFLYDEKGQRKGVEG